MGVPTLPPKVYEYRPLVGEDRTNTPPTVDIRSLLKVPDSNESPDSPPIQPARARSISAPAPPRPAAAVQPAAYSSTRPTTPATLAPAATITGGPQPVAAVAPSVGAMYAAAAPPPPHGAYPFLGGGGYTPAGAFMGGGLPGPVSAAPGGGGGYGSSGLSSGPGPAQSSRRSMPPHTSESPAKKQSKWSPEEDALIIELRGSGMKWEDISKRLPGRSSISCRLHYQNYLERRSTWDEERKNKLARLYERFKPEMWAKVAEEMQVPWRAAEAMHWQLGETDMARRAGVVPFALNASQDSNRSSPSRSHGHGHGHAHSQSQGSLPRSEPHLLGRYAPRGPIPHHHQHPPPSHPLSIPPPIPSISPAGPGRGPLPRRDSMPSRPSPGDYLHDSPPAPGPGLPPIQSLGGRDRGNSGSGMQLPSVAELTTGVSPYSTPAYSLGGVSASPSATASPRTSAMAGPQQLTYSPGGESTGSKRGRTSPDTGREAIRRRH